MSDGTPMPATGNGTAQLEVTFRFRYTPPTSLTHIPSPDEQDFRRLIALILQLVAEQGWSLQKD